MLLRLIILSPFKKIARSNFWIRLTHWEFWPFEVVYIPIFFYWLWLSLRARSFFFFTASNPGIEYGGMLGESKYKILKNLPVNLIPKTVYVPHDTNFQEMEQVLKENSFSYPIILKPDIGERGWQVEKILNPDELRYYLQLNRVDILIQEYVDLPLEFGIFYYRFPGKKKGRITSIVEKKMLEVVGDGSSNIRELMNAIPRAKLQVQVFENTHPDTLNIIPKNGKHIELMPIGNHSRGTTFLNANDLISDKLNHVFDKISKKVEGFYFGRFDIRCASTEELNQGNLKIMELNGAGSEPGHIYHPGATLIDAYKSLFAHWKALFLISRANYKRGVPYLSFSEGLRVYSDIRAYNKIKVRSVKVSA